MQVLARQVDALDAAGPAFECDGAAAQLRLLDGVFGVDEPLLVERSESRAVERRREGREGHLRSARIGESASLAERLVDDSGTYLQRRGEVLSGRVQVRMPRLCQRPGEQQADRPCDGASSRVTWRSSNRRKSQGGGRFTRYRKTGRSPNSG
jgi:hypothetical protein